ncbi:ABC transporter permease [Paenibacillus lignilyticus]|uniref:ABC transporter permease subunit n=1 Tax=Paenibacillus lignilyticus TaxID=1172615 RepID=A0ABS5CBY2_9BACL|nr:ABC transporter permease subunit [Paenibacillus lignilyticus]MBP3961826.1 ABC transporter permease subunit [Paenibacillus lignilyticus]MBP3963503.1 ABC transporter permease subunit [Paenibacillus lignilyticus]
MNKTLFIGLFITILMILASFLGQFVAPHDLSDSATVDYVVDENGNGTLLAPPFPPNASYPFGTDKFSVDMMAKLLAGAKFTIIASLSIAAFRIIVGGVLGMLLGFVGKGKTTTGKRHPLWSLLNGIPIFILVWMIMIGISIEPSASPLKLTVIIAVVLALVGIPTVASTMKEKTMILREKQFVLSAKSIGASRWSIIRKHLFPHLKESFLILFVQEIVLILGLFGQLAIFHIFVGGTAVYYNPPDPPDYVSISNEWSGLVGQARSNLFIYQWVLVIPLLAYLLYILGFHMISIGLEKLYKKRFSKFSHF